jgi:hypothetical protein
MIAMRMRESGFKTALNAAAFGTEFKVSRPRGSFTLHKDVTRPAVFLAGGSGKTSSCRGRGRRASCNGPLEGAGHMRDSQDKG